MNDQRQKQLNQIADRAAAEMVQSIAGLGLEDNQQFEMLSQAAEAFCVSLWHYAGEYTGLTPEQNMAIFQRLNLAIEQFIAEGGYEWSGW